MTGYKALVGPLTKKQFQELVNQGLIKQDTQVQHQNDTSSWYRAGGIRELSEYFSKKKTESKSVWDIVTSLFKDLDDFFQSLYGVKVKIPKQLQETLNDYLEKGTEEVALTVGKINGNPAFIVLIILENNQPEVVAEIEIDTSNWSDERIKKWPEIGSPNAKVWMVTR